jgi:cysteine desulfurase
MAAAPASAARGMKNARRVYLDYQATTPTDPRVVEAMLPWFTEKFGNPHSTAHEFGREAAAAVERAREDVAALIGADAREIVFTSGATESNNIAVKGAARFRHRHEGRGRVVTLVTEHKCVLESARALETEGIEVAYLPVRSDGLVDLALLDEAIDERTSLVSVMAAHNEIGVLQPLAEIAALAHAKGAWFHTDGAQAAGKIPLDVGPLGIDLLSISGHKLYGPKGIGALYIRRRPRVRLEPLFDGGGQERGFRSGTVPTPLVIGLGRACALAAAEMEEEEGARLATLRNTLLTSLRDRLPGVTINGTMAARLPLNLNISIPGVEATDLVAACEGVAVSTGSACTSAEVEPSYVLRALGLSDAAARSSIRIGLGRFTTAAEVEYAADALVAAAKGVTSAVGATT